MLQYFFRSQSVGAAIGTSAVVFPALVSASSGYPANTAISAVTFPNLVSFGLDYSSNTGISAVNFPSLESVSAGYPANTAISAVNFSLLVSSSVGYPSNTAVSAVNFPSLVSVSFNYAPNTATSVVVFAALQLEGRGLQTLPSTFFQTPIAASVGGVSCGAARPTLGTPVQLWLFIDRPGRYSLSYQDTTGITIHGSGLPVGGSVFDLVRGLYGVTVTLSAVDDGYVFSLSTSVGKSC